MLYIKIFYFFQQQHTISRISSSKWQELRNAFIKCLQKSPPQHLQYGLRAYSWNAYLLEACTCPKALHTYKLTHRQDDLG